MTESVDEALPEEADSVATRRERDLTSGSLGKHIFALSLPATAEMMLFSFGALARTFWMGQVGGMALAAVTMGTTLRIVLISPMMGLSAGGMAVVARYIGARNPRGADHTVMQTILLIVFIVTPLAILGQLMGPTFLSWMGGQGALLRDAVAYVRIIFWGLLFMEMLPSLNGVIRGAGHPEATLRINLVNLAVTAVTEPVLVLGLGPFPALGVRGAAWASVLGSASGVAAQFATLLTGRAGLRLHLRDAAPDWSAMKRILRIAMQTATQRGSVNLANAVLIRLVASLGDSVLTAYSLVSRLLSFLQAPAMGIGSAAAALVGQNLGAKDPVRAERAIKLASWAALICAGVLFGGFNVGPRKIVGLFDRTEAVIAIGVIAVRYAILAGTSFTWFTVVGTALGGAGDALSPMLVSLGSMWLVQLPLCWALSRGLHLGVHGLWGGLAVGYLVSAVAMTLRFRQGHWRRIRL